MFIVLVIINSLFILLVQSRASFALDKNNNSSPLVNSKSGPVQGKTVNFRSQKVYQFLGIPYAEPPIGIHRFLRPEPVRSWSTVRQTKFYKSPCLQPNSPFFNQPQSNEDCLYLNIFAPYSSLHSYNTTSLKSVLFWIHGGGFNYGSSSDNDAYDGTALAVYSDVVVVTINYRLMSLGFANLTKFDPRISGNMGLWDQNLALKWVHDNIEHFGGDPDSVTIFGESAGSMSVSAHILSPKSRGLFKNAIMQSAALIDIERWTQPNLHHNLLSITGCANQSDVVGCLQSVEPKVLCDVRLTGWWPVYGDEFLPLKPEIALSSGKYNSEVNLLLGAVADEGTFLIGLVFPETFHPSNPVELNYHEAQFFLSSFLGNSSFFVSKYLNSTENNSNIDFYYHKQIARAVGDVTLFCPTYMFGSAFASKSSARSNQGNVFAYYLSQKPQKSFLFPCTNSSWYGTCHTDDIPFIFGLPFIYPHEYSNEDIILSLNIVDIWSNFAKFGKPPKQGQNEWPEMISSSSDKLKAMNLNSNLFGVMETDRLEFCRNNWPFPLDKPYPLVP